MEVFMNQSILKGVFLLSVMLIGYWGAQQIVNCRKILTPDEEERDGNRGGKYVYGLSGSGGFIHISPRRFTGSFIENPPISVIHVPAPNYLSRSGQSSFGRERERGS